MELKDIVYECMGHTYCTEYGLDNGMKCAYLVNRSTTTRITSFPWI